MTHTSIEFSEKQQCFHYNNGQHEEMTNGFKTLVVVTDDTEASYFCDYLEDRFQMHLGKITSFDTLKKATDELIRFLSAYNEHQYQLRLHNLEDEI